MQLLGKLLQLALVREGKLREDLQSVLISSTVRLGIG